MSVRTLTLVEALTESTDPAGLDVADIGCGDGGLVRQLAARGARAVGVETDEGQLARARAAAPVAGETYRTGRGEALPFDDAALDLLLFCNSFHHLPLAAMAAALDEVARVLRPGGRLLVVEPIAEGAYFETMRPLEDETAVRAAALAALRRPPAGLAPDGEMEYRTIVRHRDADRFLAAVTAVDPARRDRLPAVEAELRRRFAANGRGEGGQTVFEQPMRRHSFRRIP